MAHDKKKVNMDLVSDNVMRPWIINVAEDIRYGNQLEALNRTLSACPQRNAGSRGMSELENKIPALEHFRKFSSALGWLDKVSLQVNETGFNNNNNDNNIATYNNSDNTAVSASTKKLNNIKQSNSELKIKKRPTTATGDFGRSLTTVTGDESGAYTGNSQAADKLLRRYCADYNMILKTRGTGTRTVTKETLGKSIHQEVKMRQERSKEKENPRIAPLVVFVPNADTVSFSKKRSKKKRSKLVNANPADPATDNTTNSIKSLLKPTRGPSPPKQGLQLNNNNSSYSKSNNNNDGSSTSSISNSNNTINNKSNNSNKNNNIVSSSSVSVPTRPSSAATRLDPVVVKHLACRIEDIKKLRNQLNHMTGAYKFYDSKN